MYISNKFKSVIFSLNTKYSKFSKITNNLKYMATLDKHPYTYTQTPDLRSALIANSAVLIVAIELLINFDVIGIFLNSN